MTKAEFVADLAKRSGLTQDQVKNLLTAQENALRELGQRGDSLTLPGFLTFKTVEQPARERRNPFNGETFTAPAKRVMSIKAGKAFKDAVAGL